MFPRDNTTNRAKKKMSASMTETKKKSGSKLRFVARVLFFGLVAFASYGAKYLFREPWYTLVQKIILKSNLQIKNYIAPRMYAMDITEEDFSNRANFTVKTFPTTFYEKGKLGDVLNGVISSLISSSYILTHLLSVHPPSS